MAKTQDLEAHALQSPSKLAEAQRVVFERANGQRGPLVSQEVEHGPARTLGS
jgi:cold shock CspA family protein